MTQLATREVINIDGQDFAVAEFECTPESIQAAELAGSLVIAQQIDEHGNPFQIPAPGKWKPDLNSDEWYIYTRSLARIQKEGLDVPKAVMTPYFGTVRSLGKQAAYFAFDQHHSHTTAKLRYNAVPATDSHPSSSFQLYTVE